MAERDEGGAAAAGASPGRRRRDTSPAQRALGLLVRREHSRKELFAKLTARGVSEEDAGQAVERMATEGWQDDGRFAASLARMRVSTGYGPVRIRAELEMHGVPGEAIEAAFDALAEAGDGDWSVRARDLVERRYGDTLASDLALRRRAADFLLRRGFDGDSVRAAIRGHGHR